MKIDWFAYKYIMIILVSISYEKLMVIGIDLFLDVTTYTIAFNRVLSVIVKNDTRRYKNTKVNRESVVDESIQ